MPPLSEEDKKRLEAEGREALQIVGNAMAPLILALISGQPIAWAAVLLPLAGRLSKVVSAADVLLLVKAMLKFLATVSPNANVPEDIYVGTGVDKVGGAPVFELKQTPPKDWI